MLELVVVLKIVATCIAIGYSAPGIAGPRHLDHWKPIGPEEQSDFASNSKHSKDQWVNRGRIEAGTSGQTQPQSEPMIDCPEPAVAQPSPITGQLQPLEGAPPSTGPKKTKMFELWGGLCRRLKTGFKSEKIIPKPAESTTQGTKNGFKPVKKRGNTTHQGDWSF